MQFFKTLTPGVFTMIPLTVITNHVTIILHAPRTAVMVEEHLMEPLGSVFIPPMMLYAIQRISARLIDVILSWVVFMTSVSVMTSETAPLIHVKTELVSTHPNLMCVEFAEETTQRAHASTTWDMT
jgi:hypothetical protein